MSEKLDNTTSLEIMKLAKEIKQMQKELRGCRSNFVINEETQAPKRKYGSFSY